MALALLGFGAGVPATAEEDTGGYGGWHHGSGVPEFHHRQCLECNTNFPAGSNARMQPDSGRATKGVNARDEGRGRIDVVPMSGMYAPFPLRAEHYAHLCKPHRHLCDLIVEHVRSRTD